MQSWHLPQDNQLTKEPGFLHTAVIGGQQTSQGPCHGHRPDQIPLSKMPQSSNGTTSANEAGKNKQTYPSGHVSILAQRTVKQSKENVSSETLTKSPHS